MIINEVFNASLLDEVFDVVIVGAGPGGLTLACYLSRFGVRVLLSDTRSEISPLGRGELIQPLGLGILQDLGFLESLLAGEHVRYELFHFLTMDGRPLMTTAYGSAALSFPWALSIEPCLQDRLMWKHLEKSECVTVWPGSRYVKHEDRGAETFVQIEFQGSLHRIVCRSIVGDDGRESAVRKTMCLPGSVTEYKDSYLSWAFELPPQVSLDSTEGDISARYYLGPGEIFFLFSISERKRFFLYMVKDRDMKNLIEKGDAFFLGRLDRCIPGLGSILIESGFPGVSSLKEWVIKKVDLDHWSKGNGMIIGDAAHATNPHVAQGRNQAMEDGRLLAEFLLEGLKSDERSMADVLRRFEQLRIPRTKKLHALADEMCLVWNSDNPLVVWGRERVFRGISMIPSINRKVVKTISGEDFIALSRLDRIRSFLRGVF